MEEKTKDLSMGGMAIVIILCAILIAGAIYFGPLNGMKNYQKEKAEGIVFVQVPSEKEVVYVERPVPTSPTIVPTPVPTWAIPENACVEGKAQVINMGSLSGNIRPERLVPLIDWFEGKVWDSALPQIEEKMKTYNQLKKPIARIDGGTFDQVLIVKDGRLYCLSSVNVDQIVFSEGITAYGIDIDSVANPGKKMRLTSFESEGRTVMFGFSSDRGEVQSLYYSDWRADSGNGGGGYSSSSPAAGGSSPGGNTPSSPPAGGGPVLGGA